MRMFLFSCVLLLSIFKINAQEVSATDYESWSLLCGDKGNCTLSQLVAKDPEAKQVMLGVSINYALSNEFPILMLRMPPGAIAKSGVGIKIDNNKAIQLPMSQCTPSACQSVIKMDKQLLEEMRNGKMARIAYAIKGPHQVTLPLSLAGFSAAIDALNSNNQ